nr:hypothetical protein CFP56_29889 [Quercus suber]
MGSRTALALVHDDRFIAYTYIYSAVSTDNRRKRKAEERDQEQSGVSAGFVPALRGADRSDESLCANTDPWVMEERGFVGLSGVRGQGSTVVGSGLYISAGGAAGKGKERMVVVEWGGESWRRCKGGGGSDEETRRRSKRQLNKRELVDFRRLLCLVPSCTDIKTVTGDRTGNRARRDIQAIKVRCGGGVSREKRCNMCSVPSALCPPSKIYQSRALKKRLREDARVRPLDDVDSFEFPNVDNHMLIERDVAKTVIMPQGDGALGWWGGAVAAGGGEDTQVDEPCWRQKVS